MIGGGLLDQVHVQGGALSYPNGGVLDGQPWWVAPQFGVAILLLAIAAWNIVPVASQRGPAWRLPVDAAAFVSVYVASAVWWDTYPRGLILGMLTVWAVLLVRSEWSRQRIGIVLCSVAVAIGGTTYEAVLSATGAFEYAAPDYLGVPIWLPGLYLVGSMLLCSVVQRLRDSSTVSKIPSAA
jgi:hypothetical protein